MKKYFFICLLVLLQEKGWGFEEPQLTHAQVYQAAEELSGYIQAKDPDFHSSLVYRDILDNIDALGVENGLVRPIRILMSYEENPSLRQKLQDLIEFKNSRHQDEDMTHDKPKLKDVQIVANSDNQCVGQCIRDIISTAGGGATAGGAVYGPWGAVGGAIVGGALGGLACSTSPHCNKPVKENKHLVRDRFLDVDAGSAQGHGGYIKTRRERLVNPMPKHLRGW